MTRLRSLLTGAALAALALAPTGAQAYWHNGWGGGWGGGVGFGLGFGGPVFPPPAYYYAPPLYYAPPTVYYPPPPVYYYSQPSGQPASGLSCYAGAYVCPLDRPANPGAPCSCPGNAGRVDGRTG